MKLPVSMLRDFVTTALNAEQLGDLLTMAGFELEGIEEIESDSVLDVKVVANRGDGLSAFGLAREILAKDEAATATELYTRATQRFPAADINASDVASRVKITIETPACSRYAARLFDDVQNGDAPDWIQRRLRQAGLRPISLLVDITNYVMLELGQPLHAFDFPTLRGAQIRVRGAVAGESLTTLNGVDHKLRPHHMVIADADRAVAVAGVMGGSETEVSSSTRQCLLESAHFDSLSVRKTRKELGLNTDASYRFERSVDPDGVVAALNRFAELYEAATGQKPVPGVVDEYQTRPDARSVSLSLKRTVELLGMDVTMAEVVRYLTSLGFTIESATEDHLSAKVPTWRPDITRFEDLVEEVARVHGYDRIPETPLRGQAVPAGVFGIPRLCDLAREAMLRCGLQQIMSHSLRDAHPLDFVPERRVGPRNPHSPEMAYLRDSLLPGLADAAVRNGAKNLALFEVGRVFVKGEYQVDESPEISLLLTGSPGAPHWAANEAKPADFWALKGIIEELAAALGDQVSFDYPRSPDRRFHPTRQSGVLLDQNRSWAGTIGQIHPDIAEELGLPAETFLAELDILVFAIHDNAEFPLRSISRNPAVRRDIAFTLPKATAWSEIESAIRASGGEELEVFWLFDVYDGKGIDEGHHSLGVALQFRRQGENLTDEIANTLRDQVIAAVGALGASLRS